MPVTWSDEVDDVLASDLTALLAYATPAGGAVATPVSPVGMRDRDAGTVSFTTSMGFGRKLERLLLLAAWLFQAACAPSHLVRLHIVDVG